MVKAVWEYSEKTEALRLLHEAHGIATGFYRINNFIILPKLPKASGFNLVMFPKLNYGKIPRFWEKAGKIDTRTFPLIAGEKLITDTTQLIAKAGLPLADYSHIKRLWASAQGEVIETIYKIIPSKKDAIKHITIYPTAFGTNTSFNWITDKGEVLLYLRSDQGIAAIAEAILTSLTRKDIYEKLDGVWQESEIVTDWLVTQSALAKVIKKYDHTHFIPTIKGIRVKQQAKLIQNSEEYLKSLGVPASKKIFRLNGLTPEIDKRPVEHLSATEKLILRLLILNSGKVVSVDDLGNEIFKSDENFSLYAIAKAIERLRNKLEENGVSGSYIQTLRGKGYTLKN